jgi:hypothetical protein
MPAHTLTIAPSLAQGHAVDVPRLETMLDSAFMAVLSPHMRRRIREVDGATVEVPSLMAHINPALLATMSPFHLERIRMLDDLNYEGFWAKTPEFYMLQGVIATPQFLARALLALKMYYLVALVDPFMRHAVGALADPAWHGHMLGSKFYFDMGDEVFGQYIHHTILDHADKAAVAQVEMDYQYTLLVYGLLFAEYDREFFPDHIDSAAILCGHNKVYDPEVRAHALPIAEMLAAA